MQHHTASQLAADFQMRVLGAADKPLMPFVNTFGEAMVVDDPALTAELKALQDQRVAVWQAVTEELNALIATHLEWQPTVDYPERRIPVEATRPYQARVDEASRALKAWVLKHAGEIKFKDADL